MHRGINVLVAEDEPTDAILLQRAAEAEGLPRPPIIVQDGREVLAYLQGEGAYSDRHIYPVPHFLLLDLKMPRMSGFDVLHWVRKHSEFRIVPTVVMSSSAMPRDVKLAYCLGANGYMVKPTSYSELRNQIRKLFAFWESCVTPSTIDTESLPSCEDMIREYHFV
jgi:CheY-like chemotaxis protein